jgi:hypothetical protein
MKKNLKILITSQLVSILKKMEITLNLKKNSSSTPKEIFGKIYAEGLWGGKKGEFYSGTGSHSEEIVGNYVEAIREYLSSFSVKPNVVDLGCGDFAVGSRVRRFCQAYVACDVVDELISFNINKFACLDVDFRVLDLVDDDLPDGDIIFIRQVLQHLSNYQINKLLVKLYKYRYIVLTEHLPKISDFAPNLDKPMGAGHRQSLGRSGSGVVLTASPFNLKIKNETILCEVEETGGIIRTTAYEL